MSLSSLSLFASFLGDSEYFSSFSFQVSGAALEAGIVERSLAGGALSPALPRPRLTVLVSWAQY